MPKAVITFVFKVLRNGLLRCKTRQLEHENTFCRFRVFAFPSFCAFPISVRFCLIASAIIDCNVFFAFCKNGFPALRVFAFLPFSRFCRFRVFAFSCLAFPPFSPFSGFRVFAFSCSACGIPAAGTQISCAQHIRTYTNSLHLLLCILYTDINMHVIYVMFSTFKLQCV